MTETRIEPHRIRNAWLGRISGCQLGKPVELLSMRKGRAALHDYLENAGGLPLRDYVPLVEGTMVADIGRASCKGQLERSEPDDDINYTVLALWLLERHGGALTTADVGRAWLRLLPAGLTYTAERAAYTLLLEKAGMFFPDGAPPDCDLAECSDNPFSDWIGAQIRADLYGWVCPGRPEQAAELAHRDAALSHRGDGIHGAEYIAALGALIPTRDNLREAVDAALAFIPRDSQAAAAVEFARTLVESPDAAAKIHERYQALSPVHTINNLALVVWGLLAGENDYSAAVGDTVAAGLDTDCNGATVGGLWGLTGREIPRHWTAPWQGRVAVSLAGMGELSVENLIDRSVAVAERLAVD